ncbi:BapA prefix-like domain-containing protein [Phaeobacter sp. BS34]
MSTVGYIVRDMAGTKQHGTSADTPQATIATATAKDISLNLGPSDVESYARRGQDLHITLIDGQVVVLDDFFNTGATGDKNLFLSEEGNFVEVVLEDRTDGMLYASYEPLDLSGKWSAYDDMVFLDVERIEPVVAPLVAPLLGGLGTARRGGRCCRRSCHRWWRWWRRRWWRRSHTNRRQPRCNLSRRRIHHRRCGRQRHRCPRLHRRGNTGHNYRNRHG